MLPKSDTNIYQEIVTSRRKTKISIFMVELFKVLMNYFQFIERYIYICIYIFSVFRI